MAAACHKQDLSDMTQDRSTMLSRLEQDLGHTFRDPLLLGQALRHGSSMASSIGGTYQRLEFLGDSVLGFAVALLLFEKFPDQDQGGLTRMRSHLTRSATLAEKAYQLGLEQFAELGPSESSSKGRTRQALLEDLFEAVIAALILDGGWEAAYQFISRQFATDIEELDERTLMLADAKTALQEAAQGRGLSLPKYRELGVVGPEHQRRWSFAVLWDGEELARGEGNTKREAQQVAARRALARLGLIPEESQ
jgi:ribonuclease III